jgi:hypothetical protein
LRWIREELLDKWGPRTAVAIGVVEMALATIIEFMEFLAHASGWKDWMISDSVQTLAASLLPGLKEMQGSIRAPLERASNEILAFLQYLLGEQAAAVILGVGGRAVASGSHSPGSRTKTWNNRADVHPAGHERPRQI